MARKRVIGGVIGGVHKCGHSPICMMAYDLLRYCVGCISPALGFTTSASIMFPSYVRCCIQVPGEGFPIF